MIQTGVVEYVQLSPYDELYLVYQSDTFKSFVERLKALSNTLNGLGSFGIPIKLKSLTSLSILKTYLQKLIDHLKIEGVEEHFAYHFPISDLPEETISKYYFAWWNIHYVSLPRDNKSAFGNA